MSEKVIVFVKHPIPGKVKTRLGKVIGMKAAAEVYKSLLMVTHKALQKTGIPAVIYFDEFPEEDQFWPNFEKSTQSGLDLGERMYNAFKEQFDAGFKKLVIIGSDCPELDAQTIDEAFIELENKDIVLGPAKDGGYYLLGMKKLHQFLFTNMLWSTIDVAAETIQRAETNHLSITKLNLKSDLDTIDDYRSYAEVLEQNSINS